MILPGVSPPNFRPAVFIVRSISGIDDARPARYVLTNAPLSLVLVRVQYVDHLVFSNLCKSTLM
jgi:hypothetical protein